MKWLIRVSVLREVTEQVICVAEKMDDMNLASSSEMP